MFLGVIGVLEMRVAEEISDDKVDLEGCSRGIGEMMNALCINCALNICECVGIGNWPASQ